MREQFVVRPAIDPQAIQRRAGVQRDVLVARSGGCDIESACLQPQCEPGQVGRRGDQHDRVALADAGGDKSFQRVEENGIVLVDLDAVVAGGKFAPEDVDFSEFGDEFLFHYHKCNNIENHLIAKLAVSRLRTITTIYKLSDRHGFL